MNTQRAHWHDSRKIVKRIIIRGNLALQTPTQLGNGEVVGPTDMNLLRDSVDRSKALLTGTSIAGALRNYLREVQHGYEEEASPESPVALLFGGLRGDDKGSQSLLIVDDVRSQLPAAIEIRDGVRIDPRTGTAQEGAKFDVELLQAGTTFRLSFELLIPHGADEAALKQALAQALHGFEQGDIPLGARKRRGFGRCHVKQWQAVTYDLTTVAGLLAWLQKDESALKSSSTVADLLEVELPDDDARERFTLDATFQLDGSLLIRADAESGVDAGHLRSSLQEGEAVSVLPGTSVAGVLRHRALRIARTLVPEEQDVSLVDEMFGRSPTTDDQTLTASRVAVQETVVRGVCLLIQTRVKIDRFTGGAYPTALFSEEPVFGGPDSRINIRLALRNPKKHEVGLLLLLLKDLWTGDLPLGGESSVGRGRLLGLKADLSWQSGDGDETWTLSETPDGLQISGDRALLENYVDELQVYLKRGDGR